MAARISSNFVAPSFAVDQLQEQLSNLLLLHSSTDDGFPIETFVFDLMISMAVLTCGFFMVKTPSLEPRKVSWILSALTSFTCATLSLYHVNKLWQHDWDLGAIMFKDDRLSRFNTTFFIAFLLLDVILGCKYYRNNIHPVSGWFHHCLYLGICSWALYDQFTVGYVVFMVEELPTFILALGSIYPEYRTDLGFGVIFFITRLAYHSLLLQQLLELKDPHVTVWPLAAFTLCLHCYWMFLWVKGYRRLLASKREKKAL